MTFVFASEAVLEVVVRAGMVPGGPVRWRREEGRVLVSPLVAPARSWIEGLEAAGVEITDVELDGEAATWLEVLPPRAQPAWEPGRVVLFVAPSGAAAVALAAELLRLGCDRLELAFLDGFALLRASDPPYYSVARAADGDGGLAIYLRRGAVWVEAGFFHPLLDGVTPPPGHLVLVPGKGRWRTLPDRFVDVRTLIDLELPPSTALAPSPPHRFLVRPRLVSVRRSPPPTLWLLRENAIASMDALIDSLPLAEAQRLTFAYCDPLVILRARPLGAPPILTVGDPYSPVPGLTGRYLPTGTIVEPPLGPSLETLFAATPQDVAWLTPALHAERVPESAFSPLSDWIDVHIDAAKEALQPWLRPPWLDESEEIRPVPVPVPVPVPGSVRRPDPDPVTPCPALSGDPIPRCRPRFFPATRSPRCRPRLFRFRFRFRFREPAVPGSGEGTADRVA